MVVLNKVVKRYNNDGQIILPQTLIGMEVYVITKDDFDRTGEFLDRAIIKQKILDEEISKLKVELENFRNVSNARLTYVEKILSFTTSQQQVNPIEPQKQ